VKIVALLLLASSSQAAELEITYLANEGVLIACGGQKVLVDALLRDSLDDYARHPPDVQEKLETGKPPFDGIVLALATHFHLDHWDAGAISRFLKNNSSALFVSTPEATAMLPWSHREQVRAVWPETGES
jgi:L-ascorbate metabolism protein UlaG (beta-lactamase superfamily)